MKKNWAKRARETIEAFNTKAPPDHEAALRKQAEQIIANPDQVSNITTARDGDSPETKAWCEEWKQLQYRKGHRPSHPRPDLPGRVDTDREVSAELHAREVQIMVALLRQRGDRNREDEENSR